MYQPDFDLDLERGRVKEDLARRLLADDNDRLTVECKADDRAYDTGNHYAELSCKGRPSGLATTKATYWAVGLPDGVMVMVPVAKMRDLADEAVAEGKVARMTRGSHPTFGALIPLWRLVKA
jgi:hypothetical protein